MKPPWCLIWFLIWLLPNLFSALALADEVTIDWQKSEGALEYELQVKNEHQVIFNRRFSFAKLSWKGNLPFGMYYYRIRLVGRDKQVGPWSEYSPFLVNPAPPQLIVPPQDSTVLLSPREALSFKWNAVNGVDRYLIELAGVGLPPIRKMVSGNQTSFSGLIPSTYTWRVKPILEEKGKNQKVSQTQILDIKSSESWKFRLDLGKEDTEGNGEMFSLRASTLDPSLNLGDEVCAFDSKRIAAGPLGCGKIVSRKAETLGIRFVLTKPEKFAAAYKYVLFSKTVSDSQRPPSLPPDAILYQLGAERRYLWDIGLGAILGLKQFLVSFRIAYALSPRLSVGLLLPYLHQAKSGAELRVTGYFALADYYLGDKIFTGFFGEVGAGAYVFNASIAPQTEFGRVSPAALAAAGWQFRPSEQGINFRITVGAQFIDTPSITLVGSSLHGLLPLLSLNLGYTF